MRTIEQIKRDIDVAEQKAKTAKGNRLYSAETQRLLYSKQAEVYREELASAQRARDAVIAIATGK
jgi:hypothetical protein